MLCNVILYYKCFSTTLPDDAKSYVSFNLKCVTFFSRGAGCTAVEMLTGKPPLGHLEPLVAIFKIASGPTSPSLPESVSQDAKEFIQAALTWLVILAV